MKLLEFITRLNIGGPSFHILSIAEGLKKLGWDVILVTGTTTNSEGDLLQESEKYSVRTIVIPELKSSINIFKDMIAFFKFLVILKREKPDIIHSHTAKAGFMARTGGFISRILFGKRIKIVHTFHGFIFEGYFSWPVSKLILAIEKLLATMSDKIICVSDSLGEIALKKYHLGSDSKISIIHYGLNSVITNHQLSSEKKSNIFTFGIVGRLVPIKGHELFLESANLLLVNTNNDLTLQFLIVGDGPEREKIKNLANKLGIDKNVVFTGWRRDSIYNEIDVLCVTSKNEGVPFVILEALFFKKPAIAVDTGGIRDVFTIVKDNGAFYVCKEGLLVKERKSETIKEAMKFLLNNKKLCYDMGNNGHRKIQQDFSQEKMLYRLDRLFSEITKIQ